MKRTFIVLLLAIAIGAASEQEARIWIDSVSVKKLSVEKANPSYSLRVYWVLNVDVSESTRVVLPWYKYMHLVKMPDGIGSALIYLKRDNVLMRTIPSFIEAPEFNSSVPVNKDTTIRGDLREAYKDLAPGKYSVQVEYNTLTAKTPFPVLRTQVFSNKYEFEISPDSRKP